MEKIVSISTVAAKQVYRGATGEVRVMAVVEGYVMARHKGCMPFLKKVPEFREKFPERVK
ncbi:MAG: hypothetical protein CVV05_01620 [Gammaproteobacteria bacterium HGW-Gammaproteobacteria-1]|nr:MAG: hypothetical protein CVV05_01620 [Gammaproteobacteria bacterium HGW-Gammaproteobacteria-1]